MPTPDAVDLFSGPGGWDLGARAVGQRPVGIENAPDACATRAAAGLATIRGDVTTYPPEMFTGAEGLIASPPCTDFSQAGLRAGITGATGQLMHEVPRWAQAIRPRWIACEQVPPALEWWQAFARDLEALGYRCWTGILNAANYGVPQTRQRAFLLAHRDHQPHPPVATHARHVAAVLFGQPLEPWVSMAEALGWSGQQVPERGAGITERYGPRPSRCTDEPSFTITGGEARGRPRWTLRNGAQEKATVRDERSPAPTITASTDNGDTIWTLHTNRGQDEDGNRQVVSGERPAVSVTAKASGQWEKHRGRPSTTVQGTDRIAPPGHHDRQFNGAVKVELWELAVLQSFPADYPWQGNKSQRATQIGNAIPPRLAAHVLRALLDP